MDDYHLLVKRLNPERGVLVGGAWRAGSKGTFAVDDPATAERIAAVANGGADDAVAAVDAASASFREWAVAAPRRRAESLVAVRDLMVRDVDALSG